MIPHHDDLIAHLCPAGAKDASDMQPPAAGVQLQQPAIQSARLHMATATTPEGASAGDVSDRPSTFRAAPAAVTQQQRKHAITFKPQIKMTSKGFLIPQAAAQQLLEAAGVPEDLSHRCLADVYINGTLVHTAQPVILCLSQSISYINYILSGVSFIKGARLIKLCWATDGSLVVHLTDRPAAASAASAAADVGAPSKQGPLKHHAARAPAPQQAQQQQAAAVPRPMYKKLQRVALARPSKALDQHADAGTYDSSDEEVEVVEDDPNWNIHSRMRSSAFEVYHKSLSAALGNTSITSPYSCLADVYIIGNMKLARRGCQVCVRPGNTTGKRRYGIKLLTSIPAVAKAGSCAILRRISAGAQPGHLRLDIQLTPASSPGEASAADVNIRPQRGSSYPISNQAAVNVLASAAAASSSSDSCLADVLLDDQLVAAGHMVKMTVASGRGRVTGLAGIAAIRAASAVLKHISWEPKARKLMLKLVSDTGMAAPTAAGCDTAAPASGTQPGQQQQQTMQTSNTARQQQASSDGVLALAPAPAAQPAPGAAPDATHPTGPGGRPTAAAAAAVALSPVLTGGVLAALPSLQLVSRGSTTKVRNTVVDQAAALPSRLVAEHMLGASFPLALHATVYLGSSTKLAGRLAVTLHLSAAPGGSGGGGWCYRLCGLTCVPPGVAGVCVSQYRITSQGLLEVEVRAEGDEARMQVLRHAGLMVD